MPNTPDPQAAKAEALLRRFAAEAHRRKWSYDRGLDDDGVPIKSEAFDALHRLGEEMRTALEELRRTPAVVPSAAETTNRAALRDRIAEALAAKFTRDGGVTEGMRVLDDSDLPVPRRPRPTEVADAVLAVLPAPVDRAAVLEEAAQLAVAENQTCPVIYQCQPCLTRERIAADLLRAAAKEQPAVGEQPDTQTREADRIVAYTPTTRTELHCLPCTPNPAGDIWTPVTAEELDDGGICTVCGRDVLITVEADRG